MNRIIVIVGPTAVGKTKLSIELAKKYNGEVINADSTQIFKGLDIATAKVTEEEKQNIPHHLLDIREVTENYTVYDYQKDGRKCIETILENNKTPIIVGGTGLYLKALLYDYKFEEEVPIINSYDNYTNEELYNKLLTVDPNTEIHVNNRKRVVRALNYYEQTKEPLSTKEKTDKELYDAIYIGLTTDREKLYERINLRVDIMVENGLLDEAKKIFDSNISTKAILTPIGYKELFPYFENKETLEFCLGRIKQNSRRYAKRQYTWFNNQMDVQWFNVDFNSFDNTIKEITDYIDKMNKA
ncbi:MAG: tRNA (adenosine(37)-N6)-dimethylallyltransferase MiaA [Firmicutes bacterium]|nr:tRNA (adenosine(37)-N6)-dimethylallyltransferase MiaA [Bacillota bacterium]